MTDDMFVTGDSIVAQTWVNDSNLPDAYKHALLRFIMRFPQLTFYRDTAAALAASEQRYDIKLPPAFRAARQTLAYVQPGEHVLFQLDTYAGPSPRAERLDQIWYRLGLLGYPNEEVRDLLLQDHLFPIADWWKVGQSALAIKLQHDQEQIYEYIEEDLWDNVDEGVAVSKSVRAVYPSYSALLDHIIAIKLDNGAIIKAAL